MDSLITYVLAKKHTWISEFTHKNITLQQDSWISTSVLKEILDRRST